MAYTPTNWATGDKISSAGMNHLEQGVAEAQTRLRLIADITTTETGTVEITQDMDGNAFDLKCVDIFFLTPTSPDGTNHGNIAVINDGTGAWNRILTISQGAPYVGKICIAHGTAEEIGTNLIIGSCGAADELHGEEQSISEMQTNGKGIKRLFFGPTGAGTAVLSGTRIIVRGY